MSDVFGIPCSKKRKRCRICGTKQNRTRHHVVPRSERIFEPNLTVILCGPCHVRVHRAVNGIGARKRLRATFSFVEQEWIVSRMGREWLNETYPLPEGAVDVSELVAA